MPAIAQVEPLTTARALRGPFDYRLSERLSQEVVVGSMLLVPFGRREVLGVVVGLTDRSEVGEERLLAPLRALEQGVPIDLVALAEWLAREYCSTLARALALVLPPGAARGDRPLRRLVAELTPAGRALPEESAPRLGPRQRSVLRVLRAGALPATATGADHASLRRLAERGLILLEPRRIPRRPVHLAVGARSPEAPELTAEQASALGELVMALHAPHCERRLLHGVTGSGKTEVYLRLAAAALAKGRGAIVLVPEIALTPQIVSRFIARFGDTVAVLHSRLRPGERHDEWSRLRSGEARVCVGPRSAVFAPIEDLGLIVIDEEHDSSYKHEGDPRYDARRVAEERARQSKALLLLGSATPRPESASRVPSLRLARRVDGRPLPPVCVLDMRGQAHGLHPRTAQALADLRREQGKAIVLLNRRGWSNFLSCRSCGTVWTCPNCDVALIFHRASTGASAGTLACHHCGHREPEPRICTGCGSISVARHGTGTERLEHDLAAILDDGRFPIFRLDADVLARGPRDGPEDAATALLRRFEAADAGVLIGTQMVAKGHDFQDVSLGIVLDADSTLRFPDFRAEERTFALIAQLAGRVGRGGRGQVLVQTIAPEARAIACAAGHDSDRFLAEELRRREILSYPPFSSLVRIVCSAERAVHAQAAARDLRERLDALLSAQARIGGGQPALLLGPATLFRLRGRERRVLMIKALDRPAALAAIERALAELLATRLHGAVNIGVDVDPQ